ncbi:hypothetical protein F0562_000299 [Nyssa sinensis]|uniref:Uncharacterized protein n=1 Tax=Nyssa sinensis TaxID=561372 RepID=A0A5J5BZR4_9ASTE|nr:hypothetical protein F0562_000299 [Nyssa sinensis]
MCYSALNRTLQLLHGRRIRIAGSALASARRRKPIPAKSIYFQWIKQRDLLNLSSSSSSQWFPFSVAVSAITFRTSGFTFFKYLQMTSFAVALKRFTDDPEMVSGSRVLGSLRNTEENLEKEKYLARLIWWFRWVEDWKLWWLSRFEFVFFGDRARAARSRSRRARRGRC